VVALAGVTMALAACGSSNSGSGSSTTSPGGGGSSTSTGSGGSTASTNPGGQVSSAKLAAIAAAVKRESTATFKLTYLSTTAAGPRQITLEQAPPKQRFVFGMAQAIFDGTTTYMCTTSALSAPVCQKSSTNPFVSQMSLYTGTAALAAMTGWKQQIASGLTGYHLNYSTQSFAGQSAQCVTWSYRGTTAKYCVTDSGILAYSGLSRGTTHDSVQLTAYSSSAPASDFALPKGAKVAR
jgi:hypothetical protein